MELSKLFRLVGLSAYDVCHEKCVFDPFRHVYRSGKLNLLKTLISSSCSYDCLYCHNAWNKGHKATPDEIADLFDYMRERRLVNGAFLSNSISDPEKSMGDIIEAGEMIRKSFRGYLHLKIIPGCNRDQIERAVELANRVSVNLESPSYSILSELCSTKSRADFSRTFRLALKLSKRCGKSFTTQLIAGVGETDRQILNVAERIYRNGASRVYYSPFRPVKNTPLGGKNPERKKRITKLYRADALIRLYGFSARKLSEVMETEFLPDEDPKILLAMKKIEAGEELETLEIPGVGLRKAKLLEKGHSLAELKRLGLSVKRESVFLKSQKRLADFSIY